MRAAIWRKLRADIKSNKLQFALIWGVLALSTMLLLISLLMMGSAEDPWDRTFEATNGPHLWVVSQHYDLDFAAIMEDPEVTETTGKILALAEKGWLYSSTWNSRFPRFLVPRRVWYSGIPFSGGSSQPPLE